LAMPPQSPNIPLFFEKASINFGRGKYFRSLLLRERLLLRQTLRYRQRLTLSASRPVQVGNGKLFIAKMERYYSKPP
jgi:hypothetical protein